MSERRVITSLTERQVKAVLRAIDYGTPDIPVDVTALLQAYAELRSALAIYDLTRDTITRLAAVPNLDAASLTEHDKPLATPSCPPKPPSPSASSRDGSANE